MATAEHITLSEDCLEAVRLITRVRLQNLQCIPPAKARILAKKIESFLNFNPSHGEHYAKFMSYYNLWDLIQNPRSLDRLATTLNKAHEQDCHIQVIFQ